MVAGVGIATLAHKLREIYQANEFADNQKDHSEAVWTAAVDHLVAALQEYPHEAGRPYRGEKALRMFDPFGDLSPNVMGAMLQWGAQLLRANKGRGETTLGAMASVPFGPIERLMVAAKRYVEGYDETRALDGLPDVAWRAAVEELLAMGDLVVEGTATTKMAEDGLKATLGLFEAMAPRMLQRLIRWGADTRRAQVAAAGVAVPPKEEDKPRLVLRSAADREADRSRPTPQVVEGLLPVGGIGALVALPGVGKTLVACELARCIAGGALFAGRKTMQGSVLYLCPDAPASTERRLLAIGGDEGASIWTVTDPGTLPGVVGDLDAHIDQVPGDPVRMVVFDTWDACRDHSGGGYADQDGLAETIMRALREFAMRRQLAVVILHHSTRGDNSRARGTVVFDARCDWIGLVERTEGGVSLSSNKNREGDRGPVGEWGIVGHQLNGQAVPVLVSMAGQVREASSSDEDAEKADRKVLVACWRAAVKAAGGAVADIEVAKGCGISGRALGRATKRLREAGHLGTGNRPTKAGATLAAQIELALDPWDEDG